MKRAIDKHLGSGDVDGVKLAITYSIITHESASRADFADSGFIMESTEVSLREALSAIRERTVLHVQESFDGLTIYCEPSQDPHTGESTEETLHLSEIHPLELTLLTRNLKIA